MTKSSGRLWVGVGVNVTCALWISACAETDPLPSLYDDATLAAQVADGDGIDGVGARFTAFAHGREVRYWSLGRGPGDAMPIYRLCRPEGDDACAPLDHPAIVDLLPGEAGYSAYGQLHWVTLPAGWSGRLASFDEVHAYLDAHGLEMPRSTSYFIHCAIAGADAELEVAPDTTVRAETPIYVRGMEARCFDFTATRPHHALLPTGEMFERNVYSLTRADETQPLSEPIRMADMNADGDRVDSNNVFGVDLTDDDYTPLWRVVHVTVPAGLPSIEGSPSYTRTEDMFDVSPDYVITPRDAQVLDYELTEVYINCPIQSEEGAL